MLGSEETGLLTSVLEDFQVFVFLCPFWSGVEARGRTKQQIYHDNEFCIVQGLSDLEHEEDGEHNADYDHDAFLGHEDKKTFDQLSPEESKERLA